MDVQYELEREAATLARITAVAERKKSLGFGDLFRDGDSIPQWVDRIESRNNPGVQFTTATRTVVFELHGDVLRYYAGGWYLPGKEVEEWHRWNHAEGSELGDFPSVQIALAFTEDFLVNQLPIQSIVASRKVFWRQDTPNLT